MKSTCLTLFFLSFFVMAFWGTSPGYGKVYFVEDFESFGNGDDIPKKSDSWEVLDDAQVPGIASNKVALTGKVSCVLEGNSCIGYNTALYPELPESYVASVWYYHDSKQSPPPDANFVFGDVAPVWGDAILVGTRSIAPNPKNYTYRDKKGTAAVEDTKIPRITGWVHLAFVIGDGETEIRIDDQNIYKSKFGPETYTIFCCERVWDVTTGSVYYDNFVLSDTIEEAAALIAVEGVGKLAAQWGSIKIEHSQ